MSATTSAVFDKSAPSRERVVQGILVALSTVTVVYHFYFAYAIPMGTLRHGVVHFTLMLPIFYLVQLNTDPESRRDKLENAVTIAFILASLAASLYVLQAYDRWLDEARGAFKYNQMDLIVGGTVMIICTHATLKEYGKLLGGVVFVAIGYGLIGPQLPGIFFHGGMDIQRIIFINSIELNGVYGRILQIGATWVAVFIYFAGVLEAHGGMNYLIKGAKNLGKYTRSGTVQVAVISSMIMGSINGSSAANVATTGSFTIPLMKNRDIPSHYAGAIESIASTGGQILPPVMGTAAFLMADIIGIPFVEVIYGGLLPALLMYGSVGLMAHLLALRFGWDEEMSWVSADSDLTDRLRTVGEKTFLTSPYWIPIIVLLYTLIALQWDPMLAGTWASVTILPAAIVRDGYEKGVSIATLRRFIRRTLEGFKIGAVNMAPLTAVLAALGIVVQIITRTGFSQKLSFRLITIAGGTLIVVLLLTMISSILFGMGMPTSAAYIVVAILTAPVIVRLGYQPLTAHMFVFYFALLSTITPPIAISCAVAAGISGASFWNVSKTTIRIGLFSFVIPFAFIINEELIIWDGVQTIATFVIVLIGLAMLIFMQVGYDFNDSISAPVRLAYGAVAMLILFAPQYEIQAILAAASLAWILVNAKLDLTGSFNLPDIT